MAMTVRARQKLKTAEACDKFNEDLQNKIQQHLDKGTNVSFEDFDISQNPIPFEQFESMMNIISSTGARIQRMRLFGCATLDDNVMFLFADWLRGVTAENAPAELHLSDCAITQDGFCALMDAVESNDAFPTPDVRAGSRPCPLYIRLENNYIQPDDIIKEKVNDGVIAEYQKNSGPIRGAVASAPNAKVKLVCQGQGRYQQKQGQPPAPEDAPPPKRVMDRYTEEMEAQQKGGGKGSGKSGQQWPAHQASPSYGHPTTSSWGQPPQQSWGQPQQGWGRPQQQSWGQPSWQQQSWGQPQQQAQYRPATAYPAQSSAAKPTVVQSTPAPLSTARPAFNAFNAGQAKGGAKGGQVGAKGGQVVQNMSRANDRSRTPQPKVVQKKPAPLPREWEEHFSDEYQIPYFWNAKSGESLWERPT
jgi:hypothetical protein